MTLLHLALILLATARLTRLVTTDVLLDWPRHVVLKALIGPPNPVGAHEQLESASGIRGKLAYLIVCDWCSSMYVGAAVAGAWYVWGDTLWLMMVYAALSASYVTGFLASKTEG